MTCCVSSRASLTSRMPFSHRRSTLTLIILYLSLSHSPGCGILTQSSRRWERDKEYLPGTVVRKCDVNGDCPNCYVARTPQGRYNVDTPDECSWIGPYSCASIAMDAMPTSYHERPHCCHMDIDNPNAENTAWRSMDPHSRCEPPHKFKPAPEWTKVREAGVVMWMGGVAYTDKTVVVYSNDFLLTTQLAAFDGNTCFRATKASPDPTTPPPSSSDWVTSPCAGMAAGSSVIVLDNSLACYQDVDVVVEHSDDNLVLSLQGTALGNAGATWGFSNLVVTAGKACGNYAHYDVSGLPVAATATLHMSLFRHPLSTHPATAGGVHGKCTLSFWYMMHGTAIGQLLLYARINTNVGTWAGHTADSYSGDGLEFGPFTAYPKGSIVSVAPASAATRCPTVSEMKKYVGLKMQTLERTSERT